MLDCILFISYTFKLSIKIHNQSTVPLKFNFANGKLKLSLLSPFNIAIALLMYGYYILISNIKSLIDKKQVLTIRT